MFAVILSISLVTLTYVYLFAIDVVPSTLGAIVIGVACGVAGALLSIAFDWYYERNPYG